MSDTHYPAKFIDEGDEFEFHGTTYTALAVANHVKAHVYVATDRGKIALNDYTYVTLLNPKCDAFNGAKDGICSAPLDERNECPNASQHVDSHTGRA